LNSSGSARRKLQESFTTPFSYFLDDGPTERGRAALAALEQENEDMANLVGRTLYRLGERLPGRVSTPGEDRYAAATPIWSKPVGRIPRAVVYCQTADDVGSAIRAARDCGLPLSVRGGGHDWAGRALCDGVVIDLSEMRSAAIAPDERATVSGGARPADIAAATDPLGLAPVTGSVAAVGMAGLTLGGGYGPLIGRFGLALDNLEAAEVEGARAFRERNHWTRQA
jgi:FAD/FMN-containing dehydrogenase